MNDSSSSTIGIIVGLDTEKNRQEQDSDRTLDQGFVTPAPCHMPIEVVSVRVRESTRIKRENAFWSCASDRTGRERE